MAKSKYTLTKQEEKTHERQMRWILHILNECSVKKHYGHIDITFEQGRIIHVKKIDNMKPPK